MRVDGLNWIGFDPPPSGGSFRAAVQVRYRHRPTPCTVELDEAGAVVTFDHPQMAIAPGQGAAFYELDEAAGQGGDLCLGGGWIRSAARLGRTPLIDAARGADPAQRT